MSNRLFLRPQDAIVDLFSGIGGASIGIKNATGREPTLAVNHWDYAIKIHELNHPQTIHLREDLNQVQPRLVLPGQEIGLLWASPSCTKHSRAQGKARTQLIPDFSPSGVEARAQAVADHQLRSQPWIVVKWAEERRPTIIFVENVIELLQWGESAGPLPADGVGLEFRRWTQAFRDLGYSIDWQEVQAHHQGAATRRKRLFLVARRDGQPIRWPERAPDVHGRPRTALDCMNWNHPLPSLLEPGRKALAANSIQRIVRGIERYVLDPKRRVLVPHGVGPTRQDGAEFAAWVVKNYGGVLGHEANRPIGAITTVDHHALGLVELQDLKDCDPSQADRAYGFICQYYSEGGQWQGLNEPLGTIVTKGRFSLVTCQVDGRTKVITDIRYRMFQPDELKAAQGFPAWYQTPGTKRDQIKGIGNSVSPYAAAAVIEANVTTQAA